MKWAGPETGRLTLLYLRHRRFVRYGMYAAGGIVAVSVIAQLAYPSDRTLPRQRIGDVNMGLKHETALKEHLTNVQKDMRITIVSDGQSHTKSWHEVGISIDQNKTADETLSYPVWQRLIPFSGLFKSVTQNNTVSTHVDDTQLKSASEALASERYVSPANATLSVQGTTVTRNQQKPGSSYDAAMVADQIKNTAYTKNAQVQLQHKTVEPAFSKEDVEAVAKKAEAIIASEYKIDAGGNAQVVPATELASWLTFKESNDDQHIAITTDQEKIKTYLNARNKDVYKAPGQMTITTVNGAETARTADTSGQSIDMQAGANVISQSVIQAKPATVAVPISKVPPKIMYQRSYTKSQAGLNALLNDIAKDEPDMAITLRGDGINASAKGTKQYMPASTYKLSTVYSVVKRIEAGTMQWSDNVNGRTVDQCVSDMIIHSDNPCGTALGDKMTWQAITDDARSIGMGSTNLARGFVSTTNDQATILSKLQAGQLMNPDNTAKILSLMRQQKYRAGIPAGVGGAAVANKVGFIDGLLHDSAIVYSPKGTYVLAIYSNKGSWARMAGATAKINNLMNQ